VAPAPAIDAVPPVLEAEVALELALPFVLEPPPQAASVNAASTPAKSRNWVGRFMVFPWRRDQCDRDGGTMAV
jgi:hypothetical protein